MEDSFADDFRSEATFTFTKENFSKVKDTVLSPPCIIRNLPWKIMIKQHVNTNGDRTQKSLAFFLQCNGDSESSSWSCYAKARLTVVSQTEGVDDFTRKIEHSFCSKENDWGFSHFMPWNDVMDPSKGLIKNDTVIFQAQVYASIPRGMNLNRQKRKSHAESTNPRKIGRRNSSFQNLSLINKLAKIPKTDAVIVEHVTFLQAYVTDLKNAVEKKDKNSVECLLSLVRARVSVLKSFSVEDVTDWIKGQLEEALGLAENEVKKAERCLNLNKVGSAYTPPDPCSPTRIRIDWNPVPFHGKKDEWCHWWSVFECVIDKNETINEEIKMKALNECLKDDANDILGDIPKTGENYKKAIEQLQKQYGDPLLLSETYYTQLGLLTPANDLLSQRETVNKLRGIVQNLDTLRGKLTVDDHRITRCIIQKFPHEVLRYTLHSLKSSKPEVIFHPTPAELLGALEDYLLVEEFIATHQMEILK